MALVAEIDHLSDLLTQEKKQKQPPPFHFCKSLFQNSLEVNQAESQRWYLE